MNKLASIVWDSDAERYLELFGDSSLIETTFPIDPIGHGRFEIHPPPGKVIVLLDDMVLITGYVL